MRRTILLSTMLGLGACGDGGDAYEGTYAVTAHTLATEGCDNEPVPVEDPSACFSCMVDKPYFKVKKQTFFTQSFHALVGCDTQDVCDDDGDDPNTIQLGGAIFDRAGEGGRVGSSSAAAYGGTTCSFTSVRTRMILSDEGVTLTRREYRLKDGSPSADLKDDACLDLTDSPPPDNELECETFEEITGRLTSAPN